MSLPPVLVAALLGCVREKNAPGGGGDDSSADDTAAATDADGDGFSPPADCNDGDDAIHPKATEVCDGQDNDCNGEIDGSDSADAIEYWNDADDDEYGAGAPGRACIAPPFTSNNDLDCDDTRADVNPDAVDVCDGLDLDEDCDGIRDRGCSLAPFDLADADLVVLGEPEPDYGWTMGFGNALAATDLDGDGAAELVIAAYQKSQSTTAWNAEGAVHIVPGTERGTVQVGEVETTRIVGAETNQLFGYTAFGLPPSSESGFGAVAIGSLNSIDEAGGLRIFEGPLIDGVLSSDSADIALVAREPGDGFCGAAYGSGDFDADGERDHVMGCPRLEGVTGAAYLALGPVSGTIDAYDGTITGDAVDQNFALRVAVIGDADGDGADDVAIANHPVPKSSSRVFLASGVDFVGAEGAASDVASDFFELPDTQAAWALTAGDANADGYADLFVGWAGVVHGFLGSAAASISEADIRINIEGGFGIVLDASGDVDGDGSADLLGGAPYADHYAGDGGMGAAFLVVGPLSSGSYDTAAARIRMDGEEVWQYAGTSISHVPDVDGDGRGEVLIGTLSVIPMGGIAPKSAVYLVTSQHL